MNMSDRNVVRAFKDLVKIKTGLKVEHGYPETEGDTLVFRAGDYTLLKKKDQFGLSLNKNLILNFCNAQAFVWKCREMEISAAGLTEDELEFKG